MNIKTGFGFDVHQLSSERKLWLGGINIPAEKGALGHSDADVVIHAVCDALLGASNSRDIGFHFPDTSEKYKDIDSKKILTEVINLISKKGFKVGNIDVTVCLEAPKISPHVAEMKKILAGLMLISEEDVSIKATTSEQMGYVGRKEGVCAYASVLIYK